MVLYTLGRDVDVLLKDAPRTCKVYGWKTAECSNHDNALLTQVMGRNCVCFSVI
jgi:hypothetical protein